MAAAGAAIEVREIDRFLVSGQSRPQVVYEIMGRPGELTPSQNLLRTRYSEGLAAYRARRWNEAQTALTAALEIAPGDGPAQTLLGRIESMEKNRRAPTGMVRGVLIRSSRTKSRPNEFVA
jgi:hypothetical protein